jgi:ADP-ribose pyrophosphatase YjhB (NUDIX family)
MPDPLINFMLDAQQFFLAHISLDCVVFGFHENQLKVLLMKLKGREEWGLPGGFVGKEETAEFAAGRVLKERTGLDHIFLQQFHVFSDPGRGDQLKAVESLNKAMEGRIDVNWFKQRFISIGFYALVEFSQVHPTPDPISDDCQWWDLKELGTLMLDHNMILQKALETLRLQLNYQPIGYNLLPSAFTMPELQRLYEAILGRKLDRRNFHRKITAYDILKKLNERRSGVAHKAPDLYSFDLEKYHQALKEGLRGGW